jgi:hypothetical protein
MPFAQFVAQRFHEKTGSHITKAALNPGKKTKPRSDRDNQPLHWQQRSPRFQGLDEMIRLFPQRRRISALPAVAPPQVHPEHQFNADERPELVLRVYPAHHEREHQEKINQPAEGKREQQCFQDGPPKSQCPQ